MHLDDYWEKLDGNLKIGTVSYRWLLFGTRHHGSDVCRWHDDIAGHQRLGILGVQHCSTEPCRTSLFHRRELTIVKGFCLGDQ